MSDTFHELNNHNSNFTSVHIRCETLMPRIILPFRNANRKHTAISSTSSLSPGPDALVIQLLTRTEPLRRTAHNRLLTGIQSRNEHSALALSAIPTPATPRASDAESPDTQGEA
ncbi:unnamed protein product [Echinostoma caproni]|uniref:Uncharacterized protein n=1 Tax=Echinostoma caproni TaxID=27848 RepID=A0A3P8LAW6_9TREM|nr:unnamed protein product [Echinostoma caproni]